MSEKTIHTALIETFSKQGKDVWKQIATSELDGKDPFHELSWLSEDKIQFLPFYDKTDVEHLNYLKSFNLVSEQNSFLGNRKWLCLPQVKIVDEISANKTALEHLSLGADGIFFNTSLSSEINFFKLLDSIEWQYCTISFQLSENNLLPLSLSKYLNSIDHLSITGSLFWETLPKKVEVKYFLENTPKFKSLGFKILGTTPVEQIVQALIGGVELMEEYKNVGTPENVFNSISFSLPSNVNFFEEISKLKALRIVWFQIAQAYGITTYKPSDLHIHSRSEPWGASAYQPHGNMLKETTCAIASILGGCSSLSIHPEDENNNMMNRVARNVSNILREESYLNKVTDPTAGVYAIDNMVHEMANKAWTIFQSRVDA
jgi:methylmalonyl-CoA mutase